MECVNKIVMSREKKVTYTTGNSKEMRNDILFTGYSGYLYSVQDPQDQHKNQNQ